MQRGHRATSGRSGGQGGGGVLPGAWHGGGDGQDAELREDPGGAAPAVRGAAFLQSGRRHVPPSAIHTATTHGQQGGNRRIGQENRFIK